MTGKAVFPVAGLQSMCPWGWSECWGSAALERWQRSKCGSSCGECITPRTPRAQAFVYVAGVQLLLAMPRQALLGAAVGAAVGVAQRCNLLGLRELRVRACEGV
jgi:hypothetical protein